MSAMTLAVRNTASGDMLMHCLTCDMLSSAMAGVTISLEYSLISQSESRTRNNCCIKYGYHMNLFLLE